jgi:uncharacterized protein YgbK (DUF1537 family)
MDQRPLRLAFYGDDFTGSTDALEVLAFAGLRCALLLDAPTPQALARLGAFDAIGIAGDSRGMSPAEMDAQLPDIFERLMRIGAPIVHYKVCSTFDSAPEIGNIGRVMEIARLRDPDRIISIIAGTPDLARYCAFANLFARSGTDGEVYRIDQHPIMSRHPVTPMRHGNLIDHFTQQTNLSIAGFSFPHLERGRDAADAYLQLMEKRTPDAVLFDSCNAEHLAEVARLASCKASAAAPAFVVGGSGVEHGLTQLWQATGLDTTTPAHFASFKPVDRILAVSGSASKLTSAQIETAMAAGFVDLPAIARDLVGDRWRQSSDALVAAALTALADGRSVLIHTARGADDARIGDMREAMMLAGHSAADATLIGGRLLAHRLGLITQAIVAASSLRRIVISGGDTSSQVTKVLAPDALEIAARLAPGAPLCRMLSASEGIDGMEIALKGGQMGDVGYFVTARNGTM